MTDFTYSDGETTFRGRIALPAEPGPHPAVVIFPSFMGCADAEHGVAQRLAELGYVGIAADPYGEGRCAADHDEAYGMMGPLVGDRALLQRRVLAAVEAAKAHEAVDASRVACIGYCFGGLCALDVARAGADVRGVASFHGLFSPSGLEPKRITAKVVAFHGWDDPLAKPDTVLALAEEMSAAGADWQVHAYGGTVHAFTNPGAADPANGIAYNAAADRRSWAALQDFLAECFA